MKYEGNLYGKIGRKYVQLIDTTKDIEAKDARIAELEAHQEYQLREEGALRDTIDRLKADLTEERAKVERLRDVIADLIAGGESAEQADPRLGYIELQTDRETLTRAREALAATATKET